MSNLSKIKDKLNIKFKSSGFNLDKIMKNIPSLSDLIDVINETINEIFLEQNSNIQIKGNSVKLGPSGLQKDVAYKGATVKFDMTTDPKFFAWIESFHALLQSVYPEPGYGSPDVFATALKVLISQKPTSLTGKITDGSNKVKSII